MIYADNAATTKLDKDAFDAMCPFLLGEYGNASQPYSFSRTPKKAVKEAREVIAQCIGAKPEEIIFTSGGTESDNWAIKGILCGQDEMRELITSVIEHHAILHPCEKMEKLGRRMHYVSVNAQGQISVEDLYQLLTCDTALVSIMMANNEIGSIQDIAALANAAHSVGALFHTDAVQALGHVEIDVDALGVDMMSASAHKFNGPKGIGFLYVREGVELSSYVDGGAQEFGRRAGTENVAAIVGMATALKKNCSEIDKNTAHLRELEMVILNILDRSGVCYRRNGGPIVLPGNLSLSFKEKDGEAMLHRLDLMGISVSTGSACDSKNNQISHVLKAIGADDAWARGTVRITLGKENTIEEAERIANALVKIAE